MRRPCLHLLLAGLWLFTSGCPRSVPPPSPPAPAVPRIPEGCGESLSGVYRHQARPTFRYQAIDDGGSLLLRLEGAPGPVEVQLQRTPEGFVGGTRAIGRTDAGVPCPLVFPTEVLACPDGGLWLRAASALALDERCQAPAGAPSPATQEHLLLRLSDAGS